MMVNFMENPLEMSIPGCFFLGFVMGIPPFYGWFIVEKHGNIETESCLVSNIQLVEVSGFKCPIII